MRIAKRLLGIFLTGALLGSACVASEDGDETTEEDRDPVTARDASRGDGKDGGRKAADAGRKDGGKTDAAANGNERLRDAGRAILDAARAPGKDEDGDPKEPESEGDDDDVPATEEPQADGAVREPPPSDADAGAPGGRGEVITTEAGDKIYVDPSCSNLTPMFGMRSIELVGCCMEQTMMCGLSTHKLMLPAQFASMFPTKCRGYEELAMFMLMPPEPKGCTLP